jgi:hypothetical protein
MLWEKKARRKTERRKFGVHFTSAVMGFGSIGVCGSLGVTFADENLTMCLDRGGGSRFKASPNTFASKEGLFLGVTNMLSGVLECSC